VDLRCFSERDTLIVFVSPNLCAPQHFTSFNFAQPSRADRHLGIVARLRIKQRVHTATLLRDRRCRSLHHCSIGCHCLLWRAAYHIWIAPPTRSNDIAYDGIADRLRRNATKERAFAYYTCVHSGSEPKLPAENLPADRPPLTPPFCPPLTTISLPTARRLLANATLDVAQMLRDQHAGGNLSSLHLDAYTLTVRSLVSALRDLWVIALPSNQRSNVVAASPNTCLM